MSKNFIKRSLSFVLLIAALLCFAAPSWARPNWVSFKSKVSIVRNDKQKDSNAGNYKRVKVSITYTNNSKDKIIKAFFNKSISFTCDFYVTERQTPWMGNDWKENVDVKLSSFKANNIKYAQVNKCEVYPGQSYTLNYFINFSTSKWSKENRKKFNTGKPFYKNLKNWAHDFQVQTEKIQ